MPFPFINIKPTKINIDAFTYREDLMLGSSFKKANEALPTWWKQLPKSYKDSVFDSVNLPTMKKCMGFIDLFKVGFIIESEEDQKFDNDLFRIDLKFSWIINESKGINFIFIQPMYNYQDLNRMFSLSTKICNFKKPQEIEISLILNKQMKEENESIFLQKSTPIVHIIPLVEHQVCVTKHLISKTEYYRIMDMYRGPYFV